MSHCNIYFDECRNVSFRHYCFSHCNIYFHECHNVTSTLMNVTMWHHIWWCCNVTSTLMNVIMRHQLWWMSICDIHQCQLRYKCHIETFIKVNFDECRNATSTLMNVPLRHQLWWHQKVTKTLVYVILQHILYVCFIVS